MGNKDLTEKNLEKFKDICADIINVLIYDGEQVVLAEDLSDATEESIFKIGRRVREQKRDTAKYWSVGNVRIAMFGLENQTGFEKAMPLRIIGYDGAEYRNELSAQRAARTGNRKRRAENIELLPVPPLYPVVTLVLHFGYKKKWDPRYTSLKECFTIPKGLSSYVSDYRINVFDIAFLSDEQLNAFQSDFRIVADYFVQQRKVYEGILEEYSPSMQTLVHVEEVLNLMTVFTGDNSFVNVYNEFINEKVGGEITMDLIMSRIHDKIKEEKERAEAEKERAEAEKERAEAEKERADAAEERAKAAEEQNELLSREIEQLKAQLGK